MGITKKSNTSATQSQGSNERILFTDFLDTLGKERDAGV